MTSLKQTDLAVSSVAKLNYAEPGAHRIAARVTDVFDNDGIATVSCEVV